LESSSNAAPEVPSDAPRRFSLAGRLAALVAATVTASVLIAVVIGRIGWSVPLTASLALLVTLPLALLATRNFSSRITRSLMALLDGVRGFRDEDFSLRLAVRGRDEISELIGVYNEMGDVLRSQRTDTVQKEMLLDTILQGSPTAIILTNPAERVVYANRAARELVGQPVEARPLGDVVAQMPAPMREAVAANRDVLFTLPGADREETFHITRRSFRLNTQQHAMMMIERLTPELRRQEVAVWKQAIRTMSHELNNSLAPISSLVHTVRHVVDRPDKAHHLEEISATLDERLRHLRAFLEGYAEFARLPAPRRQRFGWSEFADELRRLYPFRLIGTPRGDANVDRTQMQQAIINLLKNAQESGSPADDIAVEILSTTGGTQIRVFDRGSGMDDSTRRQAIVPFYSTKPSGTGLGLAICNEIVDAHGGRLSLHARDGGGTVVTIWIPE
jgi:nitrogen fixation/metabolism regulation signal transduction histidine kinase